MPDQPSYGLRSPDGLRSSGEGLLFWATPLTIRTSFLGLRFGLILSGWYPHGLRCRTNLLALHVLLAYALRGTTHDSNPSIRSGSVCTDRGWFCMGFRLHESSYTRFGLRSSLFRLVPDSGLGFTFCDLCTYALFAILYGLHVSGWCHGLRAALYEPSFFSIRVCESDMDAVKLRLGSNPAPHELSSVAAVR